MIDIDDSIIEVHGHSKHGSGYGYSGIRDLNSLITTVSTSAATPVITGQRHRKGSARLVERHGWPPIPLLS